MSAVALAPLLAATACPATDAPDTLLAPQGVTPGRRLPWPEETKPVTDWSFADREQEIGFLDDYNTPRECEDPALTCQPDCTCSAPQ